MFNQPVDGEICGLGIICLVGGVDRLNHVCITGRVLVAQVAHDTGVPSLQCGGKHIGSVDTAIVSDKGQHVEVARGHGLEKSVPAAKVGAACLAEEAHNLVMALGQSALGGRRTYKVRRMRVVEEPLDNLDPAPLCGRPGNFCAAPLGHTGAVVRSDDALDGLPGGPADDVETAGARRNGHVIR